MLPPRRWSLGFDGFCEHPLMQRIIKGCGQVSLQSEAEIVDAPAAGDVEALVMGADQKFRRGCSVRGYVGNVFQGLETI